MKQEKIQTKKKKKTQNSDWFPKMVSSNCFLPTEAFHLVEKLLKHEGKQSKIASQCLRN